MSNTYCEEADIQAIFGATNVEAWSDLDNDENDTKIDARWAAAIAAAGDEIDSWLLSSRYAIPLVTSSGSTPALIETLAAEYAGVWLYEHRGIERENALQAIKEKVQITLQQIRNGDREIDAV